MSRQGRGEKKGSSLAFRGYTPVQRATTALARELEAYDIFEGSDKNYIARITSNMEGFRHMNMRYLAGTLALLQAVGTSDDITRETFETPLWAKIAGIIEDRGGKVKPVNPNLIKEQVFSYAVRVTLHQKGM